MTHKKPRAVIFDCDEVLLDWPKAFITYHNEKYGTELAHKDYQGTLTDAFGINEDLVNQRMYEFNEHAWQFGQLEGTIFTRDPMKLSAIENLQKVLNTLNWLFKKASEQIQSTSK